MKWLIFKSGQNKKAERLKPKLQINTNQAIS